MGFPAVCSRPKWLEEECEFQLDTMQPMRVLLQQFAPFSLNKTRCGAENFRREWPLLVQRGWVNWWR